MKKNNNLAIIIQCRLSSTRLPEKALKMLGGKTVLEWTLSAMKKVPASRYFVATDENSYEKLKPIAEKCDYEIFSGPLDDVLERYCLLIEKINCKKVLRATADNPFLFYEAASLLVSEFEKQQKIAKCDYMTFSGLPHGSGVEIFLAASLLEARSSPDAFDHEHVGPALYNHKNKFTSLFIRSPDRFYFPHFRTTIDTLSDYHKAVAIVQKLSPNVKKVFEPYTAEEIISALKDSSLEKTILFMPSVQKGQGTGHLQRCLKAAIDSGGFVYIPKEHTLEETSEIVFSYLENGLKKYQIVDEFPEKNEYSLIVADMFFMTEETAKKIHEISQTVFIDEGGQDTKYCDFLLDIIPSEVHRRPNDFLPALIEKPKNKKVVSSTATQERISRNDEVKILVAFGGEDDAGLTEPVEQYFKNAGFNVTAVTEHVPNLKEELYKYDVVVTHFGLTAFEAASAGDAVILFSPTKLHEKLGKKSGFLTLSKKILNKPFNKAIFENSAIFPPRLNDEENFSLGQYIKKIANAKQYSCPICGNAVASGVSTGSTTEKSATIDAVVRRVKNKTYRRCSSCGIIYLSWIYGENEKKYDENYFNEQYKTQYGKTYIEDFDNIKKASQKRLMHINSLLQHKRSLKLKPTVLDVGCAYGPFLKAASEIGYDVYGTDISKNAINYVQNKLFLPATVSNFFDFDSSSSFGINAFDAVTMWYVIEHFKDLSKVLEKVNTLLKDGGVFAFSTPSGSGVSAKKNRQVFFEESPSDHYTIWESSRVSAILKQFGFKVVRIISMGHHAERFPEVKKHGWKKDSNFYKLYNTISHLKKLGDTMEVYCKKM